MNLRDTADMSAPGKKIFVKTFGCQMNVYDSERMSETLRASGYAETATPDGADLILLNTCHIREKAAEKLYSELGRMRAVKNARAKDGVETMIAVAGCVAQGEGAEIAARAPVVELVVGPQSYHRLPELLTRARAARSAVIATEFAEDKFERLPPRRASGVCAFLTVQEGCDKFCTFCVVPYTRGAEYSRPVAQLVTEAEALIQAGAREITLLGQNVNAYCGEDEQGCGVSLAGLIRRIAQIGMLERIRYTTSHPRDMGDDLIALHRDEPKLMPYLHLPFQSGSDRILAAMNRKHTMAEYGEIVGRLRSVRPDLALSTDIIVGFPGETDADFAATLAAVRRFGFAHAFSFKYSARPGTPAATLPGQVPEQVKTERLLALQAEITSGQVAYNQSKVGQRLYVLFDRKGRELGQLIGRSPYLQSVHAKAEAGLLGRVAAVDIVAASQNSLTGVIKSATDYAKTRLSVA